MIFFWQKPEFSFSLYILKFSEVFSFADQGQRKSFDDERALENAKLVITEQLELHIFFVLSQLWWVTDYEVFLTTTFWYFTKTTM